MGKFLCLPSTLPAVCDFPKSELNVHMIIWSSDRNKFLARNSA
jgi:hypothetical protein